MPIWPFRRSRTDIDAELLLAAVTEASRRPSFFGDGRAPDTLLGRFELMTLNGVLALHRLKAEPALRSLAQSFTDKLFRQFDAGLREEGISDTAVPKRMHNLAGSFFGRVKAYAEPLDAGDRTALAAALGRNVLGDPEHPFAQALAGYALRAAEVQAATGHSALFHADGWPPLEG